MYQFQNSDFVAMLHPGHRKYGGMTKPYCANCCEAADGSHHRADARRCGRRVDRAAQVEALARAARRDGDDLSFPSALVSDSVVVQWPEGRPEGRIPGLHLIRHMHGAEHDVQLD